MMKYVFWIIFGLLVLESCASNKNIRKQKPCDCPEFDNKPSKRKKHSNLLDVHKNYYWLNTGFIIKSA